MSDTPPGRLFDRYKPRNDPSDYPRRPYGSTLVGDLTGDGTQHRDGGRNLHSEIGVMQVSVGTYVDPCRVSPTHRCMQVLVFVA